MVPVMWDADVDPDEQGISYAQWKADQLNAIFAEHGALGAPGRIVASTVEDGLTKQAEKQRYLRTKEDPK